MARKRVAGRFVTGTTDEPEQAATLGRRGTKNARFFRTFARRQLAQALPEIVSTLLDKAKKGSGPHLKLLVLLSGLDKEIIPPRGEPKGKSLEQILTEQWALDKAEAALKPQVPLRMWVQERDPFGLGE